MNKYTVLKWEKLLLWLLPPVVRKKTHLEWLNVLLAPLRTIYDDIIQNAAYRAGHLSGKSTQRRF
jgi:hypothetical protein